MAQKISRLTAALALLAASAESEFPSSGAPTRSSGAALRALRQRAARLR